MCDARTLYWLNKNVQNTSLERYWNRWNKIPRRVEQSHAIA